MKTQKTGTTLGLPSRVRDWVLERLQWENWKGLLKHGRVFAKRQIRGRCWRGVKLGGRVLPEGHDAESVASEVAAAMLRGECRMVLGWTWERLTRELERLVSNEVRRLHGLKETREMRNEWDILPARADGELQSIFPSIAGSMADPSEEAMRHEEEAVRAEKAVEVERYLGRDKGARGVFQCLCKGVFKRREIAAELGIGVGAVTAARKRLERKVMDYRFGRWMVKHGQNGKGKPRMDTNGHEWSGNGAAARGNRIWHKRAQRTQRGEDGKWAASTLRSH